jgi:hypothetical protein
VTLAFCWAHWRRRFYEIAKARSAPIAEEVCGGSLSFTRSKRRSAAGAPRSVSRCARLLIAETLDEAFKEYSAPQPERALPPPVAVPELGAAGCVSCTHTRAILQQAGWGSLLTRTQAKTHDAAG